MARGPTGAETILLFVVLAFTLGPSIAWVVIGARTLNDPCVSGQVTPNMSQWLLSYGCVGLGMFVITMVAHFANKPLLDVILRLIFGLFNLAWLIVGAVTWSGRSCECKIGNYDLFASTFAAILIGFAQGTFVLHDAQTKNRKRN
eukprot:gnl/Spiro4/25521_TR12723_c0_g1_i1.p1 gnl/Spiro4/25521_TR12723_c0_g1~~gnl/Spiro4/25521_TR12723_c0_g1_i1.p1  ORF type:complete len:145 (+),score=15.56 gnl/Spiro4/25521_TR12723_c0_g1_i1:69-503(+)